MNPMARLLLLDDEVDLREELASFFRDQGHTVVEAGDLRDFRARLAAAAFDIVLIDRTLPSGDGLTLVDEVRAQGGRCGIIVFSARVAVADRVEGLKQGADHYVTKPVNLDELAAVVDALSRRLGVGVRWHLNPATSVLRTPDGAQVTLTAQECHFLEALACNTQPAVSRKQVIQALGKDYLSYDPRSLDALVLRLRKKVAAAGATPLPIRTVHGQGFALGEAMGLGSV